MARTGYKGVVLLAEDIADDALLIRKAFIAAGITQRLRIVRDGEEAIEYLHGVGPYANRAENPLPQLLLLDLKMPRMTGFDVLQWIRSQPGLRNLRIVVLTASRETEDRQVAYHLGANAFLVKPADFAGFKEISQEIKAYWLEADRAPSLSRPSRGK